MTVKLDRAISKATAARSSRAMGQTVQSVRLFKYVHGDVYDILWSVHHRISAIMFFCSFLICMVHLTGPMEFV